MATDYRDDARELVQSLLLSVIQKAIVEEGENQTQWPSINEFNQKSGELAVETFIESWRLDESWRYCIDYLNKDGHLYCYRATFSQPTRRKPVPRATASIYFYLSDEGNDDQKVTVYYIVEGHRVVLRPGREVFQEKWLKNVISYKLAIAESCQI